ncbi:UNVERIFIED_CONTAM: hypothetical protein GTU68_005508 [Idotea baltica]|nr:hypothetical protein [Idotea baltica]
MPLGLGLALASEAPPISGIIAAVVGGIVVAILGGSNVTIAGPGNGLVIVLLGAITTLGGGDMYQGYLFTLAAIVFSGILMLLLGFLKMGRLGIESLLSIKAVDKLDPLSRRSNVNKDLKALGLATVISGMLGGLNVVAVIARSSVNVNNGATNRSANFFHALFLGVLVLLFQEQLRKIPLAALAAILVYTGYKLATPKTFGKIAKIGREQIIIFLVTLITTLFTNLITGISAGIVVTFFIHVVMNKSFSLFLSHLSKPNILMFKEPDEGNYYINLKYFSSFLNFYKLKNKLDAVPENEHVVIDFSLCNFVDHTVMEGLENYADTFAKKGGSIEIIGLDKHGAETKHPFASRIIVPLAKLNPIERFFTKRQEQLKASAKELQWTYNAKKNTKTQFLQGFVFFRTRQIPYLYNVLSGKESKYKVFDVEFTEGAFIAREVVKTTIMNIELKTKLPIFTLDKEDGLLDLMYGLAGFKSIDIKNHPDFNKRFYLSCESKKQVCELFTDELVLFFESNPYYHVESNGTSLLITKKERLLSVQEIKALIFYGKRLTSLVEKFNN